MRWAWILFFAGLSACAGSTTKTIETDDGSVEVLLMDIVSERCQIPELETYFNYDSAILDGEQSNLNLLAQCLVDGPLREQEILLVGHADARGESRYNKKLGLIRARRVGAYLEKKGVLKSRIKYVSRGEEDAASKDPAGSERDRRVDINILL